MGTPMAGHLIKAGHQLFVLHAAGRMPEAIAAGRRHACTSARERGRSTPTSSSSWCPTRRTSKRCCSARTASPPGSSKGKTVVDMSSISPIETKDFAKKINALGCDYLDAPVSGGEVGAKNATLSIMVGGDAGSVRRGSSRCSS